jgi:hypothetical protein
MISNGPVEKEQSLNLWPKNSKEIARHDIGWIAASSIKAEKEEPWRQ